MSTSAHTPFENLLDDAAMFPPGNASAEDALTDHLRIRRSAHADLVGPLLVPAADWDSFVAAHARAGRPAVRIVLIGTTVLPAAVPPEVTVAGFELAVPDVPLPAVSPHRSLAAEFSPGAAGGRVLAAVAGLSAAGLPVVAKYRTGGTTAEAFPSADVLAAVISLAVAADAPLKLTAGLHHAVRFTDAATGFEHHGFLNVMVAFSLALQGAEMASLVAVLEERDPGRLVDDFARIDPDHAAAVRRSFVSFGCCGVEDPIQDLETLELIPAT